MRRPSGICCCVALLVAASVSPVQATWSIILADTESREVAVGTVTCLNQFDLLAVVPVVVVGKGGGAVQSYGDFEGIRRPIIFEQLAVGTHPEDILEILAGITGHEFRQYGIADTQARAVTFSGESNGAWAGGVVGATCSIHYAIQGNVLAGSCVVEAIELAVRDTPGDLPTRLMAGMQAAREQGGDGRCSCSATNPTVCGCPVPGFAKSGHIGGMIVARIGDVDDEHCDADGCADGDYFMRLNVAFQENMALDPVLQLQAQFEAWRSGLAGRTDAVHSVVTFEPPHIPADGIATATMRITLLDWQDQPVRGPMRSVIIEHSDRSAGLSAIGPVVANGDHTYSAVLTAGTSPGIDRFTVTIDDAVRPVVLMPEPAFEYCSAGLCYFDCNQNGVADSCELGNQTSQDCNANAVPDECDVLARSSVDCDGNLVPDECEPDCNENRIADACDIADATSPDLDGNGVPDECHAILRVPSEYPDLHTAFAAAKSGDTVFVAPGTYAGAANRNIDFGGRGILVKCESGPDACVVDCESAGRAFVMQSGEAGAAIEGFTITNGLINRGAALYCANGSTPAIRNCVLVGNVATDQGGALWLSDSSPALARCRLIGNSAMGVRGGGGIYVTAPANGAGPKLYDCLLVGNSANNGGAVYNVGGVVLLHNCTLAGNSAAISGGALFATFDGHLEARNSILWDDTALNGPEVFLNNAGAVWSVMYSDVEGGVGSAAGSGTVVWGPGNLGADLVLHAPSFVNPDGIAGDYHLNPRSVCIEAGDPGFIPYPGETDLDGLLRLVDADHSGLAGVDMGAYEIQSKQTCPTDLNGDGFVNSYDLGRLLGGWGSNPGHPADLNFDGLINMIDLADLMRTWGTCGA